MVCDFHMTLILPYLIVFLFGRQSLRLWQIFFGLAFKWHGLLTTLQEFVINSGLKGVTSWLCLGLFVRCHDQLRSTSGGGLPVPVIYVKLSIRNTVPNCPLWLEGSWYDIGWKFIPTLAGRFQHGAGDKHRTIVAITVCELWCSLHAHNTVKNVWGNVQCGKTGGFRGNTMDLQALKTVFGYRSDFCYKLTLLFGRTYICLQLL